ncbi:MAG: sigma-70 family RNA polymerase sigma factor [Planctomycetales bacterium]|nr:sigma-70 family RNA polymerase sigma factor [Planctomycetales bacterium]
MSFSDANRQGDAEPCPSLGALDRATIERLFGEHRAYLFRVASARLNGNLKRRVDASDIVQEAQAEAYRRIDAFLKDPQVPLKIWLRKLIVERLLMAQRQHVGAAMRSINREAIPDGTSLDVAKQILAEQTSPSQVISKRETAEQIRAARMARKYADREVVLLHLYEGLNSKESAAVLGIEPATARKRLARALQRLRILLGELGPEE